MPRGKKKTTSTGAPAQPVVAFEGQGYGAGAEQTALQETMPAADLQSVGLPSAPGGAPAALAGPPVDVASLLSQAPTGLLGGTQEPGQPITAGLTSGAGPGPEAMSTFQSTTPLRRMLTQLHQKTGDPLFRELIERARL